MKILLEGFVFVLIFDHVLGLGLISLHNGRVIFGNSTSTATRSYPNSNAARVRSRSRYLMRPRQRDASVFRLKFLDGSDPEAFEVVNPAALAGSGFGAAESLQTAGPQIIHPLKVSSDYFVPEAKKVPSTTPPATASFTAPSLTKQERNLDGTTTSVSSHAYYLSNFIWTISHPSTTPTTTTRRSSSPMRGSLGYNYRSANKETFMPPGWSSLSDTRKTLDMDDFGLNSTNITVFETIICNGTMVASSTEPMTTKGNPCIIDGNTQSTRTIDTNSSKKASSPVTSTTTKASSTTGKVIESDTTQKTTSLKTSATATKPSSTTRLSTTIDNVFDTSTEVFTTLAKSTAVFTSTSNRKTTTKNEKTTTGDKTTPEATSTITFEDGKTTFSNFPTRRVTSKTTTVPVKTATFPAWKATKPTTTLMKSPAKSIATTTFDASTAAVDKDTTATVFTKSKLTSTVAASTAPTLPFSTGQLSTVGKTSKLVVIKWSTGVTKLPTTNKADSNNFTSLTDNLTALTTTEQLQKDDNYTNDIPFNNLNVAKVRMSVHVTSIFTRKQLKKLLQQGLQNAFISALNRNNRMSDVLLDLKRIIRMTSPMIEVISISVPNPNNPKAIITHLNVTFGAVLHSNEHHNRNYTVKRKIKKNSLAGRHVRAIMRSVSPIELSAAAGIPIESIRPVNKLDYDEIIGHWFSNESSPADNSTSVQKSEAIKSKPMPDWVLPVVIVIVAVVLLVVYFVVTGICVLKGYRLRLEKVGTIASTSPISGTGDGSYAEGAARLAEVVSLRNKPIGGGLSSGGGSPSNFPVKPLAPGVAQMFSQDAGAAAKQQLELRRWTMDNQATTPDDRMLINRLQQQALGIDVGCGINRTKVATGSIINAADDKCDKSINTSTVAVHNMATATDAPKVVNRATSASHHHTRQTGTCSTQIHTDQSTDTAADISQKLKNAQTTTVNMCFNSTTKESTTAPDSPSSTVVMINGERIEKSSDKQVDRQKKRSRRRKDRFES